MKNLSDNIVVLTGVCESLNVTITDCACWEAEEDHDLYIHGSVFYLERPEEGRRIVINADLMDTEGRVVWRLRDYSVLLSTFGSFEMLIASYDRFFAPMALTTIRIYPVAIPDESGLS